MVRIKTPAALSCLTLGLSLLSSLLSSLDAFSSDFPTYYPREFHSMIQTPRESNETLKSKLFKLLNNAHLKTQGSYDSLAENCSGQRSDDCYQQKTLDYSTARQYLFGKIHLEMSSQGPSLQDVYCQKTITSGVGPMRIPSATEVNCEHTWPQSKFTGKFPKHLQKGDLHHLYPTDDQANSIRGNYPFADVDGRPLDNCASSSIGQPVSNSNTGLHFEPPAEHKGNVARAIFYFSIRYQMSIDPIQENYLRQWNEQDPVDQDEIIRNETIFKIQGNRNPFIDFPHLSNAITDF